MNRILTEKQEKCLEHIKFHITAFGCFPTYTWLGRKMGVVSTASIRSHLEALEIKGFLKNRGKGVRLNDLVNQK